MAIALRSRVATTARDDLYTHFKAKIQLNPELNRQLVSYQADKETPAYRWFKYREGFTSRLVEYLLQQVCPQPGQLLDPFSGSGAALFAAAAHGWESHGIEVLPVGFYAMEARKAATRTDPDLFCRTAEQLRGMDFAPYYDEQYQFKHIAITKGAFPLDTERALVGYIAYCNGHIADANVRQLALYASFCILEDISYTRKDGQYLRWDHRSGRTQATKPFNKGLIYSFAAALGAKLDQIAWDISAGAAPMAVLPSGQLIFDFMAQNNGHHCAVAAGPVPQITVGSCLDVLPTLPNASIDCLFTSPPYANRYDYTRTYALELVYLGCSHTDVTRLRQAMLSCTVENKAKRSYMRALYEQLGRTADCVRVEAVFEEQAALQEVLAILDDLRAKNELNNAHIADLVRNYFYEMCFVIHEMARILVPGGHVIMVNDNVRYAGEEVPVDLILSSMAEQFGLQVERIWTLARGKGNSSQQMGVHGRTELRKCVYVWRKPA